MLIKLTIVCTLFVLVNCNLEELDKYLESLYVTEKDACLKNTNTDNSLIEQMEKTGKADSALDCFFGCVMQRMGLVRDDGTYDEANINKNMDMIPDENIKTSFKALSEKIKEGLTGVKNLCEAGGKLQKIREEYKSKVNS